MTPLPLGSVLDLRMQPSTSAKARERRVSRQWSWLEPHLTRMACTCVVFACIFFHPGNPTSTAAHPHQVTSPSPFPRGCKHGAKQNYVQGLESAGCSAVQLTCLCRCRRGMQTNHDAFKTKARAACMRELAAPRASTRRWHMPHVMMIATTRAAPWRSPAGARTEPSKPSGNHHHHHEPCRNRSK